ncbi:MAG: GDSL-type esterase/lipase family protein [Alphaproteobacteria bacterium]
MIRAVIRGLAISLLIAGFSIQAKAGDGPCLTPDGLLDLGARLPRVEKRVAQGQPVVIVAIGSSSTAGAGASRDGATYPARLAAYWPSFFPASPVTVINRGVGGEDAREMIARFERDVEASGADLILWQLGVNAVLRQSGVADQKSLIADGIARLKTQGSDVVLIDLQFAPKVVADPDHQAMQRMLKDAASEAGVGLFQRFSIMRYWRASGQISPPAMISADGLHLTDHSYDCWAGALAAALARSVPSQPVAGLGAGPIAGPVVGVAAARLQARRSP